MGGGGGLLSQLDSVFSEFLVGILNAKDWAYIKLESFSSDYEYEYEIDGVRRSRSRSRFPSNVF